MGVQFVASFNPSFGILLIQTTASTAFIAAPGIVSIPRSGFCSFRRLHAEGAIYDEFVSIPRSGFCSFRLLSRKCRAFFHPAFQSLVRDSAHSDILPSQDHKSASLFQSLVRDSAHSDLSSSRDDTLVASGFNPSFGILLIQTTYPMLVKFLNLWVSIPRSGFCSFRQSIKSISGGS